MKIRTAHKPPARVMWGMAVSPAGKLAVGLTSEGEVCRIAFLKGRKAGDALAEWQAEWPQTKFVKGAELAGYAGKPVLLVGTLFQHAVWRAMSKIPAGRTATYGELARRIGKPGAARAIGAACGANPVPYVVPCHRVVATTGLGGYSGGVGIKEMLLKVEGIEV